MEPSPASLNQIHPGLTGNMMQLGMGTSVIQVCPISLPQTIPPFLLRELGHELKTPLTGLLGLAQLFRAEIKPNTQRQSQCAHLIYQKAQQLLISIYDLMDLSQLACHQFSLNVQSLNLSQVIQTAWQATIAQYDESSLPIKPNFLTEVEQVTADAVRLKQLFIHLISHFLLQLPKDNPFSIQSSAWGNWVVIQCHTPDYQLTEAQQVLFHQYLELEDPSTLVFSDLSSIFKLLLVNYLARLQGGTTFFQATEQSGLEYTILLPQDITTLQKRPDGPSPFRLTDATSTQRQQTLQHWQTTLSTPNVPTDWMSRDPLIATLELPSLHQEQSFPLTLLQIDSPQLENAHVNHLFNQLASLHQCSIVTADHVEQAELLFRVWAPHIVVCTTQLAPAELSDLVDSALAASPIVFMDCDDQSTARLQQTPLSTYFYTADPSETLTVNQQVEQLYRFLRDVRINS
jgi:hypothetical protein